MGAKKFYLVSALQPDSSKFCHLKRYDTKEDAIARAREVIGLRAQEGKPYIPFYVLEAVAIVETLTAPTKVTELKKGRG